MSVTSPVAPSSGSAAAGRHPGVPRALPDLRLLLALTAGAVALTFVLKGYQLFQASMVLAYTVGIVGLNLLTGFNGQVSLGHGAFFALGAYLTAMLSVHLGVPYWLGLPLAGAVAFAAGYLFGRPAIKLEGLYLALATFALAVAMPTVLKYKRLEPWTGGVGGLGIDKPAPPAWLPLDADQWIYLYCLAVTGVMFWIARNLVTSGTGRALMAIRDHAMAAETMGIDKRHAKCMAFGVSAAFTAVGGAMSTVAVQYIAPDSFTVFLSISLLVGMVVGGVGNLWAAPFGALFIMFVPQLAGSLSKAAPWAAYGVVMILFVFVLPGGVASLPGRLRRRR